MLVAVDIRIRVLVQKFCSFPLFPKL